MMIMCNGASGNECEVGGLKCKEGMGGGGAGGSVFIISKKINSILNVEVKGGKGADISSNDSNLFGPGGGGSGGVLITSENSLPTNLILNKVGGVSGTNIILNNPHGAATGNNGIILFNQTIQNATNPFFYINKKVGINFADTGCSSLKLNAFPINLMDELYNYTWSFSDGSMIAGQHVVYTFPSQGDQPVKISYTDSLGCISSLDTFVTLKNFNLKMDSTKLKCAQTPIQVSLLSNSNTIAWTPGLLFSDSTIANPIYQDVVSRYVFAKASFEGGCILMDSLKIDIIPPTLFTINGNLSICKGDSAILMANGADLYEWSPPGTLSNIDNSFTKAAPSDTTTYSVFLTNNTCSDTATLHTTVFVNPSATLKIKKSNDINCTQTSAILSATGASEYTWLPANEIEILNFATVRVYPTSNTIYKAIGPNMNGCTGKDSIQVEVMTSPFDFFLPNAFTPNNDGLNDCFRVKYIPSVISFELNIYNRYAQLIFKTNDYHQCWDGRYHSINQPSGSYLYILKANTTCGTIERKGFVELIR